MSSWEDLADETPQQPGFQNQQQGYPQGGAAAQPKGGFGMNAGATAFSYNPGASSFVPGGYQPYAMGGAYPPPPPAAFDAMNQQMGNMRVSGGGQYGQQWNQGGYGGYQGGYGGGRGGYQGQGQGGYGGGRGGYQGQGGYGGYQGGFGQPMPQQQPPFQQQQWQKGPQGAQPGAQPGQQQPLPKPPVQQAGQPAAQQPRPATSTGAPSTNEKAPAPAAKAPAAKAEAKKEAAPKPKVAAAPKVEAKKEKEEKKVQEEAKSPKKAPLLIKKEEPGMKDEDMEDEEKEDAAVEIKLTNLKAPDPRPHLNVVFIGHVDAGKSTTCGNILYLTGHVDQRTIEKYEREAKEKARESWFLAYIMDTNEEERAKGKTVEVGRAHFETENKRFTILDAPGHKSFVPNMISGAAQADIAVLIISARKGEFEAGFDRGGQTREHAVLAKTLGVNQLIVAINKMDDPSVLWSKDRYDEIEKKLLPYLKQCGYNPKDIVWIPLAGLSGQNLKEHVSDPSAKCHDARGDWYPRDKPTLMEVFDTLVPPERKQSDPLRVTILDGYKDQGVVAMGKVESGMVTSGQTALIMPNKSKVKILAVGIDEEDYQYAKPGENVQLKVTGVEEEAVCKGFVLCDPENPVPVVIEFRATVSVVELLEHRPLLTAGYNCVLHIHTACEECQVMQLLETTDRATRKKKMNPQFVKSNTMVVCVIQLTAAVCMEVFSVRPQLGRFTLRDEGKTIAVGRVEEILQTA